MNCSKVALIGLLTACLELSPGYAANPACQVSPGQAQADLKTQLRLMYPDQSELQRTLLNSIMEDYRKLCRLPSSPVSDALLKRLNDEHYPNFTLILKRYEQEIRTDKQPTK